MALNNTNYGRDAIYIYDKLLETLPGLKGHYFTLRAEGRDAINKDTDGNYTSKTITVNYVVDGATAEDFKNNLDYLDHLLNREDADISFNDDYSNFMIANVRNLGLDEKYATWGIGSYEIVCENPFRYSKTINEVTATKVTDGEQTFRINYTGTVPTEPVIEVTPGAENTSTNYAQNMYLEFINILNTTNNKNVSIGSSFPDGEATLVSSPDFSRTGITTLGWDFTPNGGFFQADFQDENYNRGAGLSYRAIYPYNWDDEDSHDPDDPKDCNNVLYKTLTTSITHFVATYSIRMYADTIATGGAIKLTAQTTDGKETGVVIYKNSLDNLKGTVLYYVDGKIMGSDSIDLQKYSSSLGLTSKEQASGAVLSESGKVYFMDSVVNKKRPQSALIEPKVVGNYVYNASNNNVSISRLGHSYTFKVGNLPIRRYIYARESDVDSYNKFNIGFKPNMISTSYGNMVTHLCGLNIMSLTKDSILNNWRILSPGSTFILNSANLDLEQSMQNTDQGLYTPELVGVHNSEHSLLIEPKRGVAFKCWYYNKTSGNDPGIKAKYNTIYL